MHAGHGANEFEDALETVCEKEAMRLNENGESAQALFAET
jgi:hypothetical protein